MQPPSRGTGRTPGIWSGIILVVMREACSRCAVLDAQGRYETVQLRRQMAPRAEATGQAAAVAAKETADDTEKHTRQQAARAGREKRTR